MRIAVLGGGAMGSLFGGLLADVADVTLLDRSAEHVGRIADRGLTIERPDGAERTVRPAATTDPAAVGPAELLLVLVKSHETAAAMADAAPIHDDATTVLTLQNGLGNAETIAEYVPEENVLAGTTAHGATRPSAGRVRHAGAGPTRIGRHVGPPDARVGTVAETFRAAEIDVEVVADIRDAVWEKVLVNVGINAATALARVPNGALVEDAAGRRLVERAVEEAVAVARAEGRTIPDDALERTLDVARATATNRSSMRRDVETGERTEIEALNGAVVDRAAAHGLAVPANRTLTDLVRLAETGG